MEKRRRGDEDFRMIAPKVGYSFNKCAYTFRKTIIKFLKAYIVAGALPPMTKQQLCDAAKDSYVQDFVQDLCEQVWEQQERKKAGPCEPAS